jgi:hypothetical protein
MGDEQLINLIAKIYRGAAVPDAWTEALGSLTAFFEGSAGLIMSPGPKGEGAFVPTVSARYRTGRRSRADTVVAIVPTASTQSADRHGSNEDSHAGRNR